MERDREVSESSALDELLESRLRQLLSGIGQLSTEEIETELADLSALMDSYARNDELLEELLDPRTTEASRRQILEALHQRVAHSGVELARLRERSRALLARSVSLYREGSALLYKRKNSSSRYTPEICSYCKGLGRSNRGDCLACQGRRVVLVHQPSLKCPRCNGSGQPTAHDRIEFSQDFCVICRGTGWAMTSQ